MEIKTIFKKAFHCLKTAVRDGYPLGFLCWEKLTWLRHLATHYFSSITTHTYRTFEAWWACGKPMQTQSLPCAKERKLRQCPFYNTSRVRYLWGRIVVSILYFANGGKEWRTKTSPSLFVKEQKKTCHVLVTLQKKYDSQFARDRSSEVSCAEDNQYYTIHNSIYSTIGFWEIMCWAW